MYFIIRKEEDRISFVSDIVYEDSEFKELSALEYVVQKFGRTTNSYDVHYIADSRLDTQCLDLIRSGFYSTKIVDHCIVIGSLINNICFTFRNRKVITCDT